MGLDQTVALRYPPPAYVTGELSFGDANAEPSFMWVQEESSGLDGLDRLTAINLRTSADDMLEGIQLVFNRSGESPLFSVGKKRRILNDTIEVSETDKCIEDCLTRRQAEAIGIAMIYEQCQQSCTDSQ